MPKLPPIPKKVWSVIGPIKVLKTNDLKSEAGHDLYGIWNNDKRTIEIDKGQPREDDWRALLHEWIHSVLADATVDIEGKLEEDVCNAIAGALIAQAIYGPTILTINPAPKRKASNGRAKADP